MAATRAVRGLTGFFLSALVAVVFLTASIARADSRVDFLATRLQYPPPPGQTDDFRVRTNAALALGASNDDAAVNPLCGGLADPSEAVRQAAAVGLRRLARATSVDCLKRRLAVEGSASVKAEIQRSIDAIGGGGSGGGSAPATNANAKFYVGLSSVVNGTSRPTSEVERIVHDAIVNKLGALGSYQIAPAGETSAQAKATIGKRKLKGYFLAVSVDKFDYSGGNLRVVVKVAVFSYPEKDLRGDAPSNGSMPGVRTGDKSSEDQLLEAVAAHAADVFAQNFQ
jgi:hypothetical protein